MVMEPGQKQLKTGLRVICDLQTFLAWLTDTCKIYLNCPYFYLSQFEHIFGFALSMYFYAQIFPLGEKKSNDMYFWSYSNFSIALRSCGRKNFCKSRKWKWNIYPVLYIVEYYWL